MQNVKDKNRRTAMTCHVTRGKQFNSTLLFSHHLILKNNIDCVVRMKYSTNTFCLLIFMFEFILCTSMYHVLFINTSDWFPSICIVRSIDAHFDIRIFLFISLAIIITANIRTRNIVYDRKKMCPFLIYLLMLAETTTISQGVIVENKYKRWFSNCSSAETLITQSAPSLFACGLFCIQSSVCKSFAWRHDECGLMDTCPRSCNPVTDGTDGWNVYSTKGKILGN